jgi:hypothetical protein
MIRLPLGSVCVVCVLGTGWAWAQDDTQSPPEAATPPAANEEAPAAEIPPVVEPPKEAVTLAAACNDLGEPVALAVRTGASNERAELLIIDASGRRVLRYDTQQAETAAQVLAELPAESSPSAIDFLNRKTLLLGRARGAVDAPLLSIFEVEEDKLTEAPKRELKAELSDAGDAARLTAMVRNSDSLFAVVTTEGDRGWLLECPSKAGALTELAVFRELQVSAGQSAAAISAKGYLVVSQKGDSEGKSRLTFLNPYNAKADVALEVTLDVPAVTSLTYSPTSGDLFAACPSDEPDKAGIYRIDAVVDEAAGTVGAQPTRIVSVANPNALAFTPDGRLWVTSSDEGGKLLRVVSDKPL